MASFIVPLTTPLTISKIFSVNAVNKIKTVKELVALKNTVKETNIQLRTFYGYLNKSLTNDLKKSQTVSSPKYSTIPGQWTYLL